MKSDHNQILRLSKLKLVKQIAEMPASIAEKTIEDIAHHKGDEFVTEILDHLSPVKIAAILRQHDFSCPSIISWLLSPKAVVNILKIDPLFWMNIYDANRAENFYQIQDDAIDLITSILENVKNRDKQGEILRHINRDSLSLLYLSLPFMGWQINKEQTLFIEGTDIDFGTADHLYEMIRWAAPQVAKNVLDGFSFAQTSLRYYITDLWSEAFDCFDTEHDYYSVEAIMFVPIN